MGRGALIFGIIALGTATAQTASPAGSGELKRASDLQLRLVTWSEGSQIIQTAWQNLRNVDPNTDCSHLVHDIYEFAGLQYPYAPSRELYRGVDAFERVRTPQPADLIV